MALRETHVKLMLEYFHMQNGIKPECNPSTLIVKLIPDRHLKTRTGGSFYLFSHFPFILKQK